jgi:surfeit locus 1 family protein
MKTLPLIPTLMVLFFVILMMNLGFWQLNRAQEKEEMMVLLADSTISKVDSRVQLKQLPNYANVQLSGHYINDAPQLLLDNQIKDQIFGYDVFTPFFIKQIKTIIMVNRGWVAKEEFEADRLIINPQITMLKGQLTYPPKVGMQLGEIQLDKDKKNQIITYYEEDKISLFYYEKLCKDLDCLFSSKILWLNKDQDHGFKREWNPIVMPASKHIGYAVQWFSMTFVLIVIFIYWLIKSKE